jgi:hypothetical protein
MQYGGIQSRGDSKMDILGDTWLKGESFSEEVVARLLLMYE